MPLVYFQIGAAKEGIRTWRAPSIRLNMSSITTSSSFPRSSVTRLAIHLFGYQLALSLLFHPRGSVTMGDAYFFITWMLTFCISTFWLNSGGNFVLLRSFASTPVAMVFELLSHFLLFTPRRVGAIARTRWTYRRRNNGKSHWLAFQFQPPMIVRLSAS